MTVEALKVNSNTYQIYANLMLMGNGIPEPLSKMNNRFVILRSKPNAILGRVTKMEIWDEVDFRTNFRFVSHASEQGFTEVAEIERDKDDDSKWTPGPGDLGAV